MLQQTQVATVQRYWGEFLSRFPTVRSLADAEQSDVLAAWSGLGYYRRARLLHQGARYVVEELGGSLPEEPKALLAVPGIGKYTAGALATIAFDRSAPLVDGNVARVMSRLDGVTDPKQQPAAAARHWPRVADIVDAGQPRVVAQALMELGATVCTPRSPNCTECPVRPQCLAHAQGLVQTIPEPKRRAASPTQQWWALAVRCSGRLAMVRRPEEGLLAGLWCLPLIARDALVAPTAEALATLLGVPVVRATAAPESVKHVFTHRVWQLQPVTVVVRRRPRALPGVETAWLQPGDRPDGGVPTVTNKLLAALDVA